MSAVCTAVASSSSPGRESYGSMLTYLIIPVRLFYQKHDALKEPAVSTAAVQHGLFWSQSVSTATAGSWLPHISCSAGAVRMKRVVISCIKSGDGEAILSRSPWFMRRGTPVSMIRCDTALGDGRTGRGFHPSPCCRHDRVWGTQVGSVSLHVSKMATCKQALNLTSGVTRLCWASRSVETLHTGWSLLIYR